MPGSHAQSTGIVMWPKLTLSVNCWLKFIEAVLFASYVMVKLFLELRVMMY